MTKETVFDPAVWANWQERFLQEEEEAYRNQPAEEPTVDIPQHELMDAKEVCAKKRWSLSTLKRYTKARKLAYIKRDGKLMFRREDVERYDKKRYIPAK
jgi:Helix-turn-helix domain